MATIDGHLWIGKGNNGYSYTYGHINLFGVRVKLRVDRLKGPLENGEEPNYEVKISNKDEVKEAIASKQIERLERIKACLVAKPQVKSFDWVDEV